MGSFYLIKPFFIRYRLSIFVGIICLITVDFLQLLIPRVIKSAVDDLTLFQIDPEGLTRYALMIVGIAVLMAVFRYFWRRCLIGLSRKIEEELRNQLFQHLQILTAPFFDRIKTGDLMSRATSDIGNIRMATGMGLVALTDSIVMGFATILFMAYIHIQLTVFVLIPMPLIIFGTRFFSKRMHRLYGEVQASISNLTETVRERFSGIRIIKAYNREQESEQRLRNLSEIYIDKNLSLVRLTGAFFPMMVLFSNISLAIVLFFGGRQTILGNITPGDFVAFISYLGLLTWPMMATGWVVNLMQRGKASLERIDQILKTAPEIFDGDHPMPLDQTQKILFENVSFAYGIESAPVLTDINLKLTFGKTYGFVGPPGAGKTTLLNLIPRIYDRTGGTIWINGTDIRYFKLTSLRSQISMIPQEPFLFAGTIRDNICFGLPFEPKLLDRIVASAALTDTIASFPKHYDTLVGEKGVILSGGQKQRIALARALLKDSPVILLDDPVSQVDAETATRIIETIRSLSGNRIILIASHRISAVRFADTIFVMNQGRITESGAHDELMNTGGYYAKTCRLQEIEDEFH